MRIDGAEFYARALQHAGSSYIWDAKGPNFFDCSGLVTYTIWEMGGPDWRYTHNAAKLAAELEPFLQEVKVFGDTQIPMDPPAGILAVYGPPGRADHIMVCAGDGRVFGACGGGSATVEPQRGACVQFRPTLRYRPGLLGLRQLPAAVGTVRPPGGSRGS